MILPQQIDHDHQLTGICVMCGERASALWSGQDTVAICGKCSTEILPALWADAVWLPREAGIIDRAQRELERGQTIYWKAIATRLAGRLEGCE
jgi:hypothetical protein